MIDSLTTIVHEDCISMSGVMPLVDKGPFPRYSEECLELWNEHEEIVWSAYLWLLVSFATGPPSSSPTTSAPTYPPSYTPTAAPTIDSQVPTSTAEAHGWDGWISVEDFVFATNPMLEGDNVSDTTVFFTISHCCSKAKWSRFINVFQYMSHTLSMSAKSVLTKPRLLPWRFFPGTCDVYGFLAQVAIVQAVPLCSCVRVHIWSWQVILVFTATQSYGYWYGG